MAQDPRDSDESAGAPAAAPQDPWGGAGAAPALRWTESGTPISEAFDDVYFSALDGRAETRHVFLRGVGLPARWRGVPRFTIAELGFGVGLNFLETWSAWAAAGPAGGRLDYVGFDLAAPSPETLRRTAARWPALARRADALSARWGAVSEAKTPWAQLTLEEGVTLTLALGDARARMPEWRGAADAWFFDGFSPAKNPELWETPLLAAAAARTRVGGRFATYAAAGWVRRNLAEAGFLPEKAPGFGRKRHMTRGGRAPPTG